MSMIEVNKNNTHGIHMENRNRMNDESLCLHQAIQKSIIDGSCTSFHQLKKLSAPLLKKLTSTTGIIKLNGSVNLKKNRFKKLSAVERKQFDSNVKRLACTYASYFFKETVPSLDDELWFLKSAYDTVDLGDAHPMTKVFRVSFTKKREEWVNIAAMFLLRNWFTANQRVTIEWKKEIGETAGHTYGLKITLSRKVLSTPQLCLQTLVHELCHCEVFSSFRYEEYVREHAVSDGRGPLWSAEVEKIRAALPFLKQL